MIAEDVYTAVQSVFSGRLYPMAAPQTVTLPYGVYGIISSVAMPNLSGTTTPINSRIQLDVFATTYAEAQTLAGSVRTAMAAAAAFRCLEIVSSDLYEDEVRLYRVSIDYSVWH